jgi:hypothetical protein
VTKIELFLLELENKVIQTAVALADSFMEIFAIVIDFLRGVLTYIKYPKVVSKIMQDKN